MLLLIYRFKACRSTVTNCWVISVIPFDNYNRTVTVYLYSSPFGLGIFPPKLIINRARKKAKYSLTSSRQNISLTTSLREGKDCRKKTENVWNWKQKTLPSSILTYEGLWTKWRLLATLRQVLGRVRGYSALVQSVDMFKTTPNANPVDPNLYPNSNPDLYDYMP